MKDVAESGQQGGGHRSRHPLRNVLQRTCRIELLRKWTVLQPVPDSPHCVVGGRVGAAEACARARVEAPAVQILVVVATTRVRTPRTEEVGSSVWCSAEGQSGPKGTYWRPKGKQTKISAQRLHAATRRARVGATHTPGRVFPRHAACLRTIAARTRASCLRVPLAAGKSRAHTQRSRT